MTDEEIIKKYTNFIQEYYIAKNYFKSKEKGDYIFIGRVIPHIGMINHEYHKQLIHHGIIRRYTHFNDYVLTDKGKEFFSFLIL